MSAMNTSHITDKLRELGLQGMVAAVEHHAASPTFADLPFLERFMHMLQGRGVLAR